MCRAKCEERVVRFFLAFIRRRDGAKFGARKKSLKSHDFKDPHNLLTKKLWCHQESNRGHKDFQSFALPTELWHQLLNCECKGSDNLCNWQTFSAFSLIFSLHLHVIQIFAVPLHRI